MDVSSFPILNLSNNSQQPIKDKSNSSKPSNAETKLENYTNDSSFAKTPIT
jgi:hypothetical protein